MVARLDLPSHPLILEPTGLKRMYWDIVGMLVVLTKAVLVSVSLVHSVSPGGAAYFFPVTGFLVLAILMSCLTGYFQHGARVMRQELILALLDVLTTFPFEPVILWAAGGGDGRDGKSGGAAENGEGGGGGGGGEEGEAAGQDLVQFVKVGRMLLLAQIVHALSRS